MSVEAQVQPARVSRPYQRDCIDSCARALREGACRVLAIIMPTGAGKTFTVASLLAQHGDVFRGVLVVAPQVAIAEAWRREVRDAGISGAHVRVITHAAALNLTADELGELEGRLLVVDEAHHARDFAARDPEEEEDTGTEDGVWSEDSTGIGAFANYWHAHGGTVLFVTATPFMNGRSSLPHGTVCWSRSIAAHAQPDPVTGERYMPGRVRMAVVYLPVEDMDDDAFVAEVVSGWVERWRLDGQQKAVFIVPSHLPGGSRRFADDLIEALRAASPGVRVQNCVGQEGSVKRSTLEALARESQLTRHADSRVDVMVSAVRFNEGTDWKFASAVYRYGVPGSFTLGMQQAGRAFRQKPDDHPACDVATYACLVPMLPDDAVAAWERYHREMVGLLVAHLESGDTGQAYVCVVQKPVRRGTGEGEDEGRADDAPPGPRMDEGEDEGGAASGEEPGEADPDAPSRTKLRTRTIVRPSLREKFDAAFSVYLYEDPEFMRVRADVQAGLVTGTSAQRMERLLREQLDAGNEGRAVRWSGARWTPKTEEERAARAAKISATQATWTPEQRAAIKGKKAATRAARTPEQREAYAAKVAAAVAARTPEEREAFAAKHAAAAAARTPEQREALAAKHAAVRAARTPEQREALAAKHAAVSAARTPEQREALAAKLRAVKAARTPEQRAASADKMAATRATRTPEQREAFAAKHAAAAAARTPEQREALAAKHAAAVAARTPEQREALAAKLRAVKAARTPEQREAYAAKVAAVVAARTPEQREAFAAKHAAAAAARTPEQREAYAAKVAAVVAARTPEQREALAVKMAATRAARTPEQREAYAAKVAAVVAARTPEQREALAVKMAAVHAARTPEQRAEIEAKKAAARAARTPEQWAKIEAKIAATREKRTPEQWAEINAKKAATRATRTPEQRAETVAKRMATRAAKTPEQRAAGAAKWAATKARRAAARAAAAQQTDDEEARDAR
jgi:hypothetical protein